MPAPLVLGRALQDTQRTLVREGNLEPEAPIWVKGPSPIKLAVFMAWLRDYPKKEDANYVLVS